MPQKPIICPLCGEESDYLTKYEGDKMCPECLEHIECDNFELEEAMEKGGLLTGLPFKD